MLAKPTTKPAGYPTTSLPRGRRGGALAPVLALLAVLVAACGGGAGSTTAPAGSTGGGGGATATQAPGGGGTTTQPPAAGGGGTVDACTFLTAADIQAVTGHAVKSTSKGRQIGIFASSCLWDLTDDAAIVPPSIVLKIMTSGGKDNYDRYFGPFYEEFGYEPIEGLGDEAADAGGGAVLVLSGDVLLDLQYVAMKPDDADVAAELARKVVANLGR